jgi:hypothetical protein
MTSLDLHFSGLRTDAADLPEDVDLLDGVLATRFDAVLDGERLYSEADFPVLDLAQRLHSWICAGPAAGSRLSYGHEALVFRPTDGHWCVESRDGPVAAEVTPAELRAAFRRFLDALDRDAAALGIDVIALLARMSVRASQPKIGPAWG